MGAGTRNEQVAGVRVSGDVIPSAFGAGQLNLCHLVRAALLSAPHTSQRGHRGQSCSKETPNSYDHSPPRPFAPTLIDTEIFAPWIDHEYGRLSVHAMA